MRRSEANKEMEAIANNCLMIFKLYCSKNSTLSIDRLAMDDSVYKLIGGLESYALSRDVKIKVVNIFDNYWISFRLCFEITPTTPKHVEYSIKEIFIKIYYGESSDTNKKLLFRVEWSSAEPGNYEHAQPHWHFHPYEIYLLSDSESFASYLQLTNENDKNMVNAKEEHSGFKYDISRFHFSISNGWQKGEIKSHIVKLDKNNISNWLSGLLCHIKKQLSYCNENLSLI